MCEKRRRHFIDLWKQTDPIAATELSQHYQHQISSETRRIEALDRQQRQVTFEDLTQTPWIGEIEPLGEAEQPAAEIPHA